MTLSHHRAIRPFSDQRGFPGERYLVERLEGEDVIELRHEKTLPERVAVDAAVRVKVMERLFLDHEEAVWLYEQLRELLSAG